MIVHALANITTYGLTESLIYHYDVPHNTSFHQGTHFIAKEVRAYKQLIVISLLPTQARKYFQVIGEQ